jgi:hypothetical protein
MWFDRKSVNYQVPNHRILELRQSWNYVQSGRRYASASYLYGNSLVCSFCSQFLSSTAGNESHHEVREKSYLSLTQSPHSIVYFPFPQSQVLFGPSGAKPIQLYETPISRNNISMNCKTYQSSEVDSHSSSNAINPPFNDGSKTRREADPWYEVDLGKTIHVHSVALTVKGPTQQKVSTLFTVLFHCIADSLPSHSPPLPSFCQVNLHIFLFKGPVGFENPFVDRSPLLLPPPFRCSLMAFPPPSSCSVREIALCHHVVPLPCSVISKLEEIKYIFPPHAIGGAIRIQLEGLQTLHIFKLEVISPYSTLLWSSL